MTASRITIDEVLLREGGVGVSQDRGTLGDDARLVWDEAAGAWKGGIAGAEIALLTTASALNASNILSGTLADARLSAAAQAAVSACHTQGTDTGTTAASFLVGGVAAVLTNDARLHTQNTDTGTTATTWTLASGNPTGDVALKFGQYGMNLYLRWNNTASRFEVYNGTGAVLAPFAAGKLTTDGFLEVGSQVYAYNYTPTRGALFGDTTLATTRNYWVTVDGSADYQPFVIHARHGYPVLKLWGGGNGGVTLGRSAADGLYYLYSSSTLTLQPTGNNGAVNLVSHGTGNVLVKPGGTTNITAGATTLGFFGATAVARPVVADPAAFGNADYEIGGVTIASLDVSGTGFYAAAAVDVEVLRDKCEELADDCRALRTTVLALTDALQSLGLVSAT